MPQNPTAIQDSSPFRLQSALADLVEHRTWRNARAQALDALERGESVALLGPAGTGKTMLLRSIGQALEGLGRHVATIGAGAPLVVPEGAEAVLVDEAGARDPADLARLTAAGPPCVLAALPGFAPHLAGLAQVRLEPLSAPEIERLVAARLAAAGRPRGLFAPEALDALARHSAGRVRLVLLLAGAALFVAEGEAAAQVSAAHVDDAAEMRGVAVEEDEGTDAPAGLPPEAPSAPLPLAAPAGMRLAMGRLPAARAPMPRRRASAWWRRTVMTMAAAGLVVAAAAAVVAPHVVLPPAPAPVPPVAEAPPPLADLPPPEIAALPEPFPAAPAPAPPAAAPIPEPQAVEPPPRRPAPPPRAARPPAPPPQAQLAPLPTPPVPVPPSPWWTERAPAPEPAQEGNRIVVREPANIRGTPSHQSSVVRVVGEGMVMRVFGRRGPWVEVGDSAPWGWIHAGAIERAP